MKGGIVGGGGGSTPLQKMFNRLAPPQDSVWSPEQARLQSVMGAVAPGLSIKLSQSRGSCQRTKLGSRDAVHTAFLLPGVRRHVSIQARKMDKATNHKFDPGEYKLFGITEGDAVLPRRLIRGLMSRDSTLTSTVIFTGSVVDAPLNVRAAVESLCVPLA
jgi:hypothetical protein